MNLEGFTNIGDPGPPERPVGHQTPLTRAPSRAPKGKSKIAQGKANAMPWFFSTHINKALKGRTYP